LLAPAFYRRWDWKMPRRSRRRRCHALLASFSVVWKVLGFLPNYWTEERLSSGSGFFAMSLAAAQRTFRSALVPYVAGAIVILATIALVVRSGASRRYGYLGASLTLAAALILSQRRTTLVFPLAAADALPGAVWRCCC